MVLDHAHSLGKHIGISKHVEVQSIGFDKTSREYIWILRYIFGFCFAMTSNCIFKYYYDLH